MSDVKKERGTSQIEEWMGSLSEKINETNDCVQTLSSRLEPVMRSTSSKDSSVEERKGEKELCHYASVLRDMVVVIDSCLSQTKDMLNRLEV